MTRAKVFRELSSEDLLQKEKALKKDLFALNYQRKMGNVEKPSRFGAVKRDIARIMTILRERESGDGQRNRKTSQ
ncbi:MAG: 50S ribosomal protein L29 [Omnitrophica WOR_2 bacterium RIFCSPLOWO2_12_FULL_50_9]|nr:MAG: 50S ribosomal protein L29 [Omnitrophica WOR_2 bacterium RIFCSPHIGHO2_02_FULL_50_17]OGX42317.1 MAG: 50S ribosomal protein L29 [Omnitrophica WOR_2 bacterium RIFCSPLOWO2_12_FULL_50_9]